MSLVAAERPLRLVLIDAEHGLVARVLEAAESVGPALINLRPAADGREALDVLRREPCDALIAMLASLGPADQRFERLNQIARAAGAARLVVLGAAHSVSATLEAMQAGAHECPDEPVDLTAIVSRLVDAMRARTGQASRSIAQRHASGQRRQPIRPMWVEERDIIERAIAACDGNITLAADALEISPSTIYRKRQSWPETEVAA